MKIASIAAFLAVCGLAAPAHAASFTAPSEARATQAVAVADDQREEWSTFVRQGYEVPRGYAYSPLYDFGNRPIRADALRAQISVQGADVCGAGVYSIDVAHSRTQQVLTRYLPDANGVVRLPADLQEVHALVVVVYQPRYRLGRCVLEVAARLAGPGPGPDPQPQPGDFVFAGVASYDGGFRHRLEVRVPDAPRVSQFWLRIPAHCQGVQVLEAGTVSEGVYDRARLVDAAQQIYAVAGGAARISAVNFSVNGPAGQTCEIPVYLQEARN